MAKITMQEETGIPSTPATGKWSIYLKSDGLYIIDDAGIETGPIIEGIPYVTPGTSGNVLTSNGTIWTSAAAAGGGNLIGSKRLSPVTNTPVITTDQTAVTTIYWTDGVTNLSIAVPETTNTPFDVFYSISGNSLATTNWTNDTTRATALVYTTYLSNVYLAKSGDTDKIYLGTGRTTGVSGQIEDSKSKRFLWNYYNRKQKQLLAIDTTDNWAYTTATIRAQNSNTTDGQGRFSVVVGVSEDAVFVSTNDMTSNGSIAAVKAGCAIDATNAIHSQIFGGVTGTTYATFTSFYDGFLAAGYHYIQHTEFSEAIGTTTWYGDAAGVLRQMGMRGTILC